MQRRLFVSLFPSILVSSLFSSMSLSLSVSLFLFGRSGRHVRSARCVAMCWPSRLALAGSTARHPSACFASMRPYLRPRDSASAAILARDRHRASDGRVTGPAAREALRRVGGVSVLLSGVMAGPRGRSVVNWRIRAWRGAMPSLAQVFWGLTPPSTRRVRWRQFAGRNVASCARSSAGACAEVTKPLALVPAGVAFFPDAGSSCAKSVNCCYCCCCTPWIGVCVCVC